MHKDILRSIQDVEIFPIIALIVFLGIFVVALIKVAQTEKSEFEEIANSALNDGSIENENKN